MGANAVPFGAVSPAVAVLLPTPIRVVVAKRAWKQGLTSVIGDAMPGVLVRGRQGSQQDHPCTHNMYSSQCLVTIARYAGLGRPACGEIGKGYCKSHTENILSHAQRDTHSNRLIRSFS